ncbi:hypothetical protein M436DRAFT_15008, partial [Aureobasidium namibiae CBS 147.97]
VQGVGGGIGFVSEAYKAHKATKAQKQARDSFHGLEPSSNDIPTTHNGDQETYALAEEAHTDLTTDQEPTEAHEPDEPTDPVTLAESFISRLPSSSPPHSPSRPLPYPIIIPQRRPSDRTRGFLQAYPPILATRSITSSTFLDFLCTFNTSTRATKWIAALNLASLATVMLPTLTSVLVSMAITAATTAAMEVQGRVKTNRFLDKVNASFFMPRGLFCLVVTWNPDTSDARTSVDFEGIAKKVMQKGGKNNPMQTLKKSNGSTYGESEWPEIAPLIYPAVDDSTTVSGNGVEAKKKSSLQDKKRFVEDYMDRRAQAKFAKDNPSSALAAGPKPQFTSRYADPSHAANSGSLVTLISGGVIQMPERQDMLSNRGGRGVSNSIGGRAAFGRGFGGASEREGARGDIGRGVQRGLGGLAGGRGGSSAGPLGLLQKVMKKDVLYLLIVDMPSDDELAAAQ